MKKILAWALGGLIFIAALVALLFTFYQSGVSASEEDQLTETQVVTVGGHELSFLSGTTPSENNRRIEELIGVLDLLPAHLLEPIGSIRINVSGYPDLCSHTWASACAIGRRKTINIHQRSDIEAYPFDWEHFAVNGYTHLERVVILTHEFGHLIDYQFEARDSAAFLEVLRVEPDSVTSYGATKPGEDFADTLVFYVFWPDYLKEHYPERHAYMLDLFMGIEYEPRTFMPSSEQDRLQFDWPIEK